MKADQDEIQQKCKSAAQQLSKSGRLLDDRSFGETMNSGDNSITEVNCDNKP